MSKLCGIVGLLLCSLANGFTTAQLSSRRCTTSPMEQLPHKQAQPQQPQKRLLDGMDLPFLKYSQILSRKGLQSTKTNDANNDNDVQTGTDSLPKYKSTKKKVSYMTLGEIQKQMQQNPKEFETKIRTKNSKKSGTNKRTRKRVENPKQQYVYASHKRNLGMQQKQREKMKTSNEVIVNDDNNNNNNEEEDSDDEFVISSVPIVSDMTKLVDEAKKFGLIASSQYCDPIMSTIHHNCPKIVGKIQVNDNTSTNSGSFAYIIDKPAGWSILGSAGSKITNKQQPTNQGFDDEEREGDEKFIGDDEGDNDDSDDTTDSYEESNHDNVKFKKHVKVIDDNGSVDILEYNELDVLSLLTPEELEEYVDEEGINKLPSAQLQSLKTRRRTSIGSDDDNIAGTPIVVPVHDPAIDVATAANIQRIEARLSQTDSNKVASFALQERRPSVVSWFKQEMISKHNVTIRGGSFWTPVIGATSVDDSGYVVLCPKSAVDNLFCDYADYIAVVGNGGYLAPTSSSKKDRRNSVTEEEPVQMEILSKLVKNRSNDPVLTVSVRILGTKSTCTAVTEHCQKQYKDGIRGDANANPFDRRGQRRLIHCSSLSVSSLIVDQNIQVDTVISELPDDIAVLAERRNSPKYIHQGSFVGRSSIRRNELTNAYREINGAADGYPGCTVDRYDKWLFVNHDPEHPRCPLPSIHDGNTVGVYYLESYPDRSSMGSIRTEDFRPKLLEGKAAPDMFPIVENGVTYLISLNQDLSTGIFLDQRYHRGWLTRNCCNETRVLNCFAHTGAFSVAAATAGASTVSIDLSKKWLDRLPHQFRANNIDFNERHDCIYGDCFEWLTRLAKRGEKFDIVILDPPSTSVGGRKKKRWSIVNDMDELVALASTLVKKGGYLWTTTNSASIHPIKFAKLCKKGLLDAGITQAKLERIQPMPSDFPTIGPQPVKNLVWKIPY